MNSADHVQFLISSFSLHLPILIVCVLGVIMTVTKWKQAPNAAMWALFGFGLALLLCFTTPVGQWVIQQWVMEGASAQSRIWAFTAFGFVNAVLHAVVFVFLLVAVFAGRK